MGYSARTTYGTQKKYSRRGQELDTQIKGLIYKDQAELEKQVLEIVDGWRDAAKGGGWGHFIMALEMASSMSPTLLDDMLVGLGKSAHYDKLRSKALKGIDLSKMEYLGQSAKDVDFEIREEGHKALEDLKFSNTIGDVGIDLLLKAVMKSEAMDKFRESWKIQTGPAGEEIVTVETPDIDPVTGDVKLDELGNKITVSENYYIPSDLGIDLENISSFEDTAQALKATKVGEYFKVDDTFYQHLDPTIGINEPILKSFGDKDDFIKEFGTKFEGDIKMTLKEKLKPGEGFLFGNKEGKKGYFKTFGEEMKNFLFEGPEARAKRAAYDYSKGIGFGSGWNNVDAILKAAGLMVGSGALGGSRFDNKDNE